MCARKETRSNSWISLLGLALLVGCGGSQVGLTDSSLAQIDLYSLGVNVMETTNLNDCSSVAETSAVISFQAISMIEGREEIVGGGLGSVADLADGGGPGVSRDISLVAGEIPLLVNAQVGCYPYVAEVAGECPGCSGLLVEVGGSAFSVDLNSKDDFNFTIGLPNTVEELLLIPVAVTGLDEAGSVTISFN